MPHGTIHFKSVELDLSDIQDGDFGFFQGRKGISKAIIKAMEDYKKNFVIDPAVLALLDGFVASHVGVFFWDRGELWLYGSIEWGFKPIKLRDHYNITDSFIVLRDPGWTKALQDKAFIYCQEKVGDSTSYPYWRLLLWRLYISTKWEWPMSWGGQRAEECYKSGYQVKREVFPDRYDMNSLYASFYHCIRSDNTLVLNNRRKR